MTVTLTRGALYLLEALLQDSTGCTTPSKMARWAKLWELIRRSNKRDLLIDGKIVDFEKPLVPEQGESADVTNKRTAALNDAFAVWQQESVPLELTDKRRDTAREAIKHGTESKKLQLIRSVGGDLSHTLSLLSAFGFDEDDE